MRTTRTIGVFFLVAMLVFSFLVVLYPAIAHRYSSFIRTAGNGLVGLGSSGRVWYSLNTERDEVHDIHLALVDPRTGRGRSVVLSSRGHGYFPTILVLALTLATPIPWCRRFVAAFWGLLWIHAYIVVKLMLFPVAYGLDVTGSVPEFDLIVNRILTSLCWVVGSSSAGWMIVPLLIWASVALPRFDWRTMIEGTHPGAGSRAWRPSQEAG